MTAPPASLGTLPYDLVTARHGRFLVNPRDTYIGRSMADLGEFCEGEVELLRQLLKPGDHLAEIGANIGAHTVPLARHVGPAGFVTALELQPLVFQMLCANLALNGLTNVDARNLACASEAGDVTLPDIDYARLGNVGGIGLESFGQGRGRWHVAMVPFDGLGRDRLDLLKIDVEGAERAVLQGAEATLRACRPALYLENDRLDRSPALIRHIMDLGYRLWWHLPPLYGPRNWAGQAENPWPGVVSCNMLCLPRERPAQISGLREVLDPEDHPLRR